MFLDRFNDEDNEMYAWGGTLENIVDSQNFSYQNSSGVGLGLRNNNTGIDYGLVRNADSLVTSNTRQ